MGKIGSSSSPQRDIFKLFKKITKKRNIEYIKLRNSKFEDEKSKLKRMKEELEKK